MQSGSDRGRKKRMKIAVISDIHANMTALKKVLEDIKNNNCDKIFCLGDLAMAGPEPNKTVDFIRSQKDWTIIQGNTDKMLAECTKELIENCKKVFPVMGKSLEDDDKIITDENRKYLKNLPAQKKLEIEGVKILLVHGSPRRNNEDILPNMPIEKVEEIIAGVDADLILCGHTHMPAGYQTNSKQTVINDGSVGRPMSEDLKSCYLILDIQNGGLEAEHRLLDYDRETAAKIIKARGFDGAEDLAKMLTQQSPRHA